MVLLGRVDELEVDREGADDADLRVHVERGDDLVNLALEGGGVRPVRVVAQPPVEQPQALLGLEQLGSALLDEDAAPAGRRASARRGAAARRGRSARGMRSGGSAPTHHGRSGRRGTSPGGQPRHLALSPAPDPVDPVMVSSLPEADRRPWRPGVRAGGPDRAGRDGGLRGRADLVLRHPALVGVRGRGAVRGRRHRLGDRCDLRRGDARHAERPAGPHRGPCGHEPRAARGHRSTGWWTASRCAW